MVYDHLIITYYHICIILSFEYHILVTEFEIKDLFRSNAIGKMKYLVLAD